MPHPQLQAFRAGPEGPLIAVYSMQSPQPVPAGNADAASSGAPRFVASIMSAERIAAYKALAVQAGPAAVTRLLLSSPPHSHWFLVPVQGFGSSVTAAIDHLRARAAYVAKGDRRLQALLAAEGLEEVR
ncbi:hypothetical protein [Burkholderia cepacia]|uniref:hypothetical protein n=1 Tax=Burkholderia cepacia TaxID=292 RepID=UPI0012D857D0|nr:hypothetical protein [Burkholderia cepacia]